MECRVTILPEANFSIFLNSYTTYTESLKIEWLRLINITYLYAMGTYQGFQRLTH